MFTVGNETWSHDVVSEPSSARPLGHDQRLRARLQWLGHLALHPNGHGCRKLFARVKNKEVSSFIQAEAVRRCLNHKENKKQRAAREFWDVDGSSHGRQPLEALEKSETTVLTFDGARKAFQLTVQQTWTSEGRGAGESSPVDRFWVWTEPVENPLNDGDRPEVISYIFGHGR